MTQSACRWCGRPLAAAVGVGRPRRFCKQACRQRDYESRRRSLEVGLSEHELVITREALESIRDRLYVLAHTVADADVDLGQPEARRAPELRRILEYVLDTARECVMP